MFVRKKKNKSGSVSVQIIQKVGRRNKLIQTVGSSLDELTIEELFAEAKRLIPSLQKQQSFNFLNEGCKPTKGLFSLSVLNQA